MNLTIKYTRAAVEVPPDWFVFVVAGGVNIDRNLKFS